MTLDAGQCGRSVYGVATAFSAFYEKCPVLTAEPQVRAGRLTLCVRTGQTLRLGLDVLGIAAPDRV